MTVAVTVAVTVVAVIVVAVTVAVSEWVLEVMERSGLVTAPVGNIILFMKKMTSLTLFLTATWLTRRSSIQVLIRLNPT